MSSNATPDLRGELHPGLAQHVANAASHGNAMDVGLPPEAVASGEAQAVDFHTFPPASPGLLPSMSRRFEGSGGRSIVTASPGGTMRTEVQSRAEYGGEMTMGHDLHTIVVHAFDHGHGHSHAHGHGHPHEHPQESGGSSLLITSDEVGDHHAYSPSKEDTAQRYGSDAEDGPPEGVGVDRRPISANEELELNAFLAQGCCQSKCLTKVPRSYILNLRRSLQELTKGQREMASLTALAMSLKVGSLQDRKRQAWEYRLAGDVVVCRAAFGFVFSIAKTTIQTLQKNILTDGLKPREFGPKVAPMLDSSSHEQVRAFMEKLVAEKARATDVDGHMRYLLPADCSIRSVWTQYQETAARSGWRGMCRTSFISVVKQQCPNVVFVSTTEHADDRKRKQGPNSDMDLHGIALGHEDAPLPFTT